MKSFKRDDLIALFQGLGYPNAETWKKKRMFHKVESLAEMMVDSVIAVEEGTEDEERLNGILVELKDADGDYSIVSGIDPDEPVKKPVKKKIIRKPKKVENPVVEDEDDEDDEDDEEATDEPVKEPIKKKVTRKTKKVENPVVEDEDDDATEEPVKDACTVEECTVEPKKEEVKVEISVIDPEAACKFEDHIRELVDQRFGTLMLDFTNAMTNALSTLKPKALATVATKTVGGGKSSDVVDAIVEFYGEASKEYPSTLKEMHKKLAKRFPDKKPETLRNTLYLYSPNKLLKERGLVVNVEGQNRWTD